jgi:hypothetical protein
VAIDGPAGAGRFAPPWSPRLRRRRAELVVGADQATVDFGKDNAGRAWIIEADGGSPPLHELGDAQPRG